MNPYPYDTGAGANIDEWHQQRNALLKRRKRLLPPTWYIIVFITLSAASFGAWVWILAIAGMTRVSNTHLAVAAMAGAIAATHGIGWICIYYNNRRHAEADEINEINRALDQKRQEEMCTKLAEDSNQRLQDLMKAVTTQMWQIFAADAKGTGVAEVRRIEDWQQGRSTR